MTDAIRVSTDENEITLREMSAVVPAVDACDLAQLGRAYAAATARDITL